MTGLRIPSPESGQVDNYLHLIGIYCQIHFDILISNFCTRKDGHGSYTHVEAILSMVLPFLVVTF